MIMILILFNYNLKFWKIIIWYLTFPIKLKNINLEYIIFKTYFQIFINHNFNLF